MSEPGNGASDVAGVILAGGLSRRMGGGDKCLRPLAGQTMLDHVIACVAPQVRHLVLNANGDPERFAAFSLPVIADPIADHPGPLVGVLAGLEWAAALERAADVGPTTGSPAGAGISAVASVPGDAPLLPADLVTRLEAARRTAGADIALAASDGQTHPVVGTWALHLAEPLRADLQAGVRKVLDFCDQHSIVTVEFPSLNVNGETIDPFFNANRPDDLAQAERILRARAGAV